MTQSPSKVPASLIAGLESFAYVGPSESMHWSFFGDELILEGRVSSYAAKCKIEEAVRSAGLLPQNCLKVMPAAFAGGDHEGLL